MLYYILLLMTPVFGCIQSYAQKQYNLKTKSPNAILFSAITTLIALCFFVVSSGFDLQFDVRLVPYSLIFGLTYASAWIGTVIALQHGPLALTTLITSFSLIIPTAYGVVLGDQLSSFALVGLALLVASMVLVNMKFESGMKISLKWLFWVMIAFVGNGVCSLTQNMHKQALGDSFSHEFMIIALSFAFVLLFGYCLITSRNLKEQIRGCMPHSIMNGLSNALLNLFVILIVGNIPNTILYPTNAALTMLFTFLLSFFFYRERYSLPQYIGYGMGMVSIVLLNL